jgi:hypothetical protein
MTRLLLQEGMRIIKKRNAPLHTAVQEGKNMRKAGE